MSRKPELASPAFYVRGVTVTDGQISNTQSFVGTFAEEDRQTIVRRAREMASRIGNSQMVDEFPLSAGTFRLQELTFETRGDERRNLQLIGYYVSMRDEPGADEPDLARIVPDCVRMVSSAAPMDPWRRDLLLRAAQILEDLLVDAQTRDRGKLLALLHRTVPALLAALIQESPTSGPDLVAPTAKYCLDLWPSIDDSPRP